MMLSKEPLIPASTVRPLAGKTSDPAAPAPRRGWLSSPWVKLALSFVLLAFLLSRTDLSDLGGVVAQAHIGWVVVAFLGYLASMVISSVRWMMLARPLGFDEPYSEFFGSYFTGVFMNLFAPSTVAGDIGRALFLGQGRRRRALAFTTVIADRGLGFVVLTWLGALAILLQPGYDLPAVLYYSAWIVPPATLLGWLYLPPMAVRVFPPANRWRVLVERDLAPYWKDKGLLLRTSVVALAFHVLQVLSQVWLAWAVDLRIPVPFFFIFVPVVNILGMIPISFSGIGIREGGYWYFLAKIGVARPAALALGLLSSAVVLATGLSGGLVLLVWKGRTPVLRPVPRHTTPGADS
jgi:uncharacterized membrane protein YbhN (UPF0104 family)